MGALKSSTVAAAAELQQKITRLAEKWGTGGYVLYTASSGKYIDPIYGSGASEKGALTNGDQIAKVTANGAYTYAAYSGAAGNESWGVKFLKPVAGVLGGKEVALEAKRATLKALTDKLNEAATANEKASYTEQINTTNAEINQLITESTAVMKECITLALEIGTAETSIAQKQQAMKDADQTLSEALGEMLQEGYYSDETYVPGQEAALYSDAVEMLKVMSRPQVSYALNEIDLKDVEGYEDEVFDLNTAAHIICEDVQIGDYGFVSEVTDVKDEPGQRKVKIETDEMNIGSKTFSSFLNRITDAAQMLKDERTIYKRAEAFSPNGMLYTGKLDGIIDVLKNQLSSVSSNWYTDDRGNLIFESLDGESAMMLCGSGFMVADGKTEDGWNWRTFGTGKGFTADMITAGVLRAGLITILGSEQFFWNSDNIYVIDPENENRQIRIGRYDGTHMGIAYTQDNGKTWQTAIGFDGVHLSAGGSGGTSEEYNELSGRIDDLGNRISSTQASLDLVPDQIRLAVEGVQIGGRNYILGTGTPYTAVGTGSRQWLYPWKCASIAANRSLYGKTVTISFDYEEAITSGSLGVIVNDLWIGVKSFDSDTGSGHFTLTREHADFNTGSDVFIYIDGTWTGSVTFSNVKVEIGNKETDWSPAPEDADAAIAELSAAISIQAGEITSNATKIETVSQAAGNAQSSANAAQNTANAAQNAANSAQGTANGAVTRVTEAEQRISAVEGAITSKVSKKEFDELGRVVSAQESKIEQTAQGIRTEIADEVEGLNTTISETASGIRTEVSKKADSEYVSKEISRIDQEAEKIELSVGEKLGKDDTASGLDTGTEGVKVAITKEKFVVDVPDEDGDFQLDRSGAKMGTLVANEVYAANVTPVYTGPNNLYVNPNATDEEMSNGANSPGDTFRSISDVCNLLNGKNILWPAVYIYIYPGTYYEDLALNQITAPNCRVYFGKKMYVSGEKVEIVGSVSVDRCSLYVYIGDMTLAYDGSTAAVRISGPGVVAKLYNMAISAQMPAPRAGIETEYGARAIVRECEIYDFERAFNVIEASMLFANNCKGNCRVYAVGGILSVHGTQPCDQTTWAYGYADGGYIHQHLVTVDQGSKPTAPPAPSTVTYDYLYSDSYRDNYRYDRWSYFDDDDIRQGYNDGTIYGVIWFDVATIKKDLNGRTINQASLRLYMEKGVGRGVAVEVQLYGTNTAYDGRSDAPTIDATYGTLGSMNPGMANEIAIPTQAITDLVNGTIQALVLKSGDTELYKDRPYSKNYAKFRGTTSADGSTCPRLTVIYQ